MDWRGAVAAGLPGVAPRRPRASAVVLAAGERLPPREGAAAGVALGGGSAVGQELPRRAARCRTALQGRRVELLAKVHRAMGALRLLLRPSWALRAPMQILHRIVKGHIPSDLRELP